MQSSAFKNAESHTKKLIKKLEYIPPKDLELVEKAYEIAQSAHGDQTRKTGEPFIEHPILVAHILADLKMDISTILTGILHDVVEDTHLTLEEVKKQFGQEVSFLVDGVTKLSQMKFKDNYVKESENIRKMFISMGQDVRVILVKLADRLHNMRTLAPMPEDKQLRISKETLNIYAPLAGRLGLHFIKIELEDLSFKYIYPEVYQSLFQQFEKEKDEREKYIQRVIDFLTQALSEKTSVKFETKGRTKNMYSIYRKMQNQNVDYEEIYDIIAFRICVEKLHECYEILGWIHSLWKPIPGRFKDFIAMPKSNNYQSLHTTVIGPQGKKIEIQIRTHVMHQLAEKGVAAHWQYKEKSFSKKSIQKDTVQKFNWLQDLVDLHRQAKHSNDFLESVKNDLFESDIYVFTPKGDVKEFTSGSTPIDFAYSVHTDLGNKLKGALVGGRIVPLKYKLKNGDVVEVITSEKSHPSREWLDYCVTSKARSRIRMYLNEEEKKEAQQIGAKILEKELKDFNLNVEKFFAHPNFKKHISQMGFNLNEEIFVQIGKGKIISKKFISKVLNIESQPKKIISKLKKRIVKSDSPIEVEGMGNVMVHLAHCCNPVHGDEILGYISIERGIVIHRRECKQLQNLDSDRYVDVSWRASVVVQDSKHSVSIRVGAKDYLGATNDITAVMIERNINILELKAQVDELSKATFVITIEVKDVQELRKIMQSIKRLKNVFHVSRIANSYTKK